MSATVIGMALAIVSLVTMMLLGVAEILAGTNPRALRTKLRASLPPSESGLSVA